MGDGANGSSSEDGDWKRRVGQRLRWAIIIITSRVGHDYLYSAVCVSGAEDYGAEDDGTVRSRVLSCGGFSSIHSAL